MSSECARRVRVRKDLTKLVSSPFGGWVFRHRHEKVQNAERSSDRHEEITRDTCIGMVANECGPTLIASVVSGRSGSRYFLTVRGETSMPSFSFSSRSETRPMPFHERLGLYDHQCTAPVEEPAEQNKPGARSGSSTLGLCPALLEQSKLLAKEPFSAIKAARERQKCRRVVSKSGFYAASRPAGRSATGRR